jgi:decaprenylphospho-beta-D-ribofuranose 2-oxidase
MTPDDSSTAELSGWGRTIHEHTRVRRPDTDGGVVDAVLAEPRLTIRGAGKSYGDAALAGQGVVLDMTARDRIISFDQSNGVIVVEAGVLLKEIADQALSLGWVLPVMPGTEWITVGGAIASDVHGKNHPGAGSFGRHVRWLALLRSDGVPTQLSPGQDADAFWSTIGGMGLTGVILQAAIQLHRVDTGWAVRQRHRTGSLPETLALLQTLGTHQEADPNRHVVAWLEAQSTGTSVGRALVDEFHPAATRDLPSTVPPFPERRGTGTTARPIRSMPGPGLMSRATILAASAARWRLSRAGRRLVALQSALCPLDRAESWPAAFGRRGLIQYQFAVPPEAADVLGEVLRFLAVHRMAPALATLKNLGPGSGGLLSFPIPGWTLAVDLPARWLQGSEALRPIDKLVAAAGGRVYLAKDALTDPDLIPVMYPRLPAWQRTQARLDPDRRWTSALAERLGLLR